MRQERLDAAMTPEKKAFKMRQFEAVPSRLPAARRPTSAPAPRRRPGSTPPSARRRWQGDAGDTESIHGGEGAGINIEAFERAADRLRSPHAARPASARPAAAPPRVVHVEGSKAQLSEE